MRRLLRLFLLSVLPGLLCAQAFAQNSPQASEQVAVLSADEVATHLGLTGQTTSAGHFVQEKYFAMLKKPFVTEGSYSLTGEAFTWQTTKPVEQTIQMQDGKLMMSGANGKLSEQPQAMPYAQMIEQLLSGNVNALAAQFSFSSTVQPQCVQLTPTAPAMSRLFSHFIVCGSGGVEQITLFDAEQNKTAITLTPQSNTTK